jgi:ABC-type glycerol-3-phosphate transport system substrate-binding protein
MSYGGKVRALPFRANPDFVMHWYKPLFQQAGFPVDKGPATIADLDKMIPALTREQDGKLVQVGMQPWDFYSTAPSLTGSNTLNAWVRAFGGSFYDEQKDVLTFNHPRNIRAVEWFTGWAQRLVASRVAELSTAVTNGNANVPFFVSRKWAMHPLTPSAMQQIKKADPSLVTPEFIGAGPMPYEAPGKPGEVTIGGWGVSAVMGSKQVDAAWEFIKYCGASVDGTLIIARTNGLPGWLKSPGLDEIAKDPMQKPYIDGIRRAEFAQYGYYVPVGPSYAPLEEAVAGKRTARDALDAMQREAEVMYDDYKTRFKKK